MHKNEGKRINMKHSPTIKANILISTENKQDAILIKKLLNSDFDKISTSTDPGQATADFFHHLPNILILAFNSLEKSENYYLGLNGQDNPISEHPHRTIVLCSNNEMQRAYKLCLDGKFDDYNMFWPVSIDVHRLPMSVHIALRELATATINTATTSKFTVRTKQLVTMGLKIEDQVKQSELQINNVKHAVATTGQDIDAALEYFSQRIARNDPSESITVNDIEQLRQEIGRLKHEVIETPLNTYLAETVRPLEQWASKISQVTTPPLESKPTPKPAPIPSPESQTESYQPTLLVVDDDKFQHKIIGSVLKNQDFNLLFATSGIEALEMIQKKRPGLIIMDFMMPEMNGVEVVQHIKAMPDFSRIPILMMTGKSDKAIVVDSLKAGAVGFIVKPIDRDLLLDRIKQTFTFVD